MVQYERSDVNLGGRAMRGAAFLAGARLIVRGISLINIVILARLLSPEDFGLAALAFAALGLIQVFSDMRVTDGLLALDDLTPQHLDTAFTMQSLRGFVMGGLLFLFAAQVSAFMGSAELTPVMQALSVVLILDGLRNPGYFMYQRNIDYSREFLRDSVSAVVASAATITIAFMYESYWALVAGALIQRMIQTALTYFRIPHSPRFTLRYWRDFIGFGAWLTFTGMISQLTDFAPRFLIGRMISPAALGTFTVGKDTSSLVTQELIAPLQRTLLPSFSAIKNDKERLRRTIVLANRVLLTASLPLGFGLALLAPNVVLILLGPEWTEAVFVLQVLAPTSAIMLGVAATNPMFMALKKVRAMFARTVLVGILIWPFLYIGISTYGLKGAVVALALSRIPSIFINAFAMKKYAGVSIVSSLLGGWRAFIAVAVMSILIILIPHETSFDRDAVTAVLDSVPLVVLGAAVYCFTHVSIWWLSGKPDDLETLAVPRISRLFRKYFNNGGTR